MPASSTWVRLDRSSEVSLSQQIVRQLREHVISGTLRAGDLLPASRSLADELKISRSVVVRAYEQLNGEGYLDSLPGSGTKVAKGVAPAPQGAPLLLPPDRSAPPAAHSRPTVHTSPSKIDLSTGNPVASIAVPEDWRKALQRAARAPLSSYAPPSQGDPTLRNQIATHARRTRGLRCTPDDVIITSGTVDALLLIALALGQQSTWGMEDPGYLEAARVLRLSGATVHAIPMREPWLQLRDLERLAHSDPSFQPDDLRALLVTPSHQFPRGGVMPAADRAALLDWANAHRVILVEDDYDSEFRYVGAALPAIAALDPGGTVAHIGSLNKSFSPSLRCGYLIASAGSELWAALIDAKHTIGATVPQFTQTAIAEFFETGGFRRYVARARREYRHRRTLLLDMCADAGLATSLSGTDGGLHAVLQLPAGKRAATIAQQLDTRGVLVDTLGSYTQRGNAPEALAIGYGAEPVTRLSTGLHTLLDLL